MWLVVTIITGLFTANQADIKPKCEKSTTGWKKYRGYEYKMICPSKWMSFQEAELQCNEYAAHLVSIHGPRENSFVHNLVGPQRNMILYSWIGLHRHHVGGEWKWTDGSDVDYLHWAYGQPDNYNGVPGFTPENCAQMYIVQGAHWDKQWNDVKCTREVDYFVCKRKANWR
ncbi:hypothetical protein Y032_0065g3633 [Ancylostoma ceylanicum]|nr:hypothetical protein Y032_0065g3633 [Ancylostoma ceylanicum]